METYYSCPYANHAYRYPAYEAQCRGPTYQLAQQVAASVLHAPHQYYPSQFYPPSMVDSHYSSYQTQGSQLNREAPSYHPVSRANDVSPPNVGSVASLSRSSLTSASSTEAKSPFYFGPGSASVSVFQPWDPYMGHALLEQVVAGVKAARAS